MNLNYQGRHPPHQLAAIVATQNTKFVTNKRTSSTPWLTDSGCNVHFTSNFGILSMSNEYNGKERILVGSGQSIPISHTGCGKIPY